MLPLRAGANQGAVAVKGGTPHSLGLIIWYILVSCIQDTHGGGGGGGAYSSSEM